MVERIHEEIKERQMKYYARVCLCICMYKSDSRSVPSCTTERQTISPLQCSSFATNMYVRFYHISLLFLTTHPVFHPPGLHVTSLKTPLNKGEKKGKMNNRCSLVCYECWAQVHIQPPLHRRRFQFEETHFHLIAYQAQNSFSTHRHGTEFLTTEIDQDLLQSFRF